MELQNISNQPDQPQEPPRRVPPPPPVRRPEPEAEKPEAPAPMVGQPEQKPAEPAAPPGGVKIRTMEEDLKAAKGEAPKKPEELAVPETTVQMPGAVEEEKPKSKTWLVIVIGAVVAIGLGFVGYFVIFPLLFPTQPEIPAPVTVEPPPAPPAPAPAPTLTHQSYFLTQPASVSEARLPSVDSLNISLEVQLAAQEQLPNGSVKEVVFLNGQGNQVPYPSFISQFFPGANLSQLTALFEDDFTGFLYYDQNGVWPGYVARLKPEASAAQIREAIPSLENPVQLSALYVTPPGTFSSFKTGQVSGQSTRYATGSQPGAAYNYGVFGEFFVISTSFDGFKTALQILGF